MGAQGSTETALVSAFMREQGEGVVRRAIASITAAGDDEVCAQLHRVAGTVGTYGFASTAHELRDLEAIARRMPGAAISTTTLDAVRAAAVAALQAAHQRDDRQMDVA